MIKASRPTPKKKPNPYLGFGWVGWVALGVLTCQILVRVLDFDWFYWVMHFTGYYIGGDAIDPVWFFHYLAQSGTTTVPMGYIGAFLILASLMWVPFPRKRRQIAAMALVLIAALDMGMGVSSVFYKFPPRPTLPLRQFGEFIIMPEYWLTHGVPALMACVVVGWTLRSWRVGASMLGVVVAITALTSWVRCGGFIVRREAFDPFFIHPSVILNLLLIFPIMIWGVREHRRLRITPHCPQCDDDLTNLPSTTCPECGEDVSAVVSREA